MGNMPKLSVIVPVYNAEQYVERCLESLINQTYSNMEVIVVDDGSTDSSGSKCDACAEKSERIKVFHVENAGVSAARNLGMEKSSGDYITFCDSDDWLELHAYEKLMKSIGEKDVDIAAFGWFVDNGTTKCENMSENAYCGYGEEEEFFSAILSMTGTLGGKTAYGNYIWNKIYKRQTIFTDEGFIGFDTKVKVAEDGLWLVDIAKQCKVSYFDSEPLYHYFVNENSVMRDKTKYMETRMASQKAHMQMLENLKEYNKKYYDIHKVTCEDYFWIMIKGSIKQVDSEFICQTFANIIYLNEGNITENIADDIKHYLERNGQYSRLLRKKPIKIYNKITRTIRKVKNIWKSVGAEKQDELE